MAADSLSDRERQIIAEHAAATDRSERWRQLTAEQKAELNAAWNKRDREIKRSCEYPATTSSAQPAYSEFATGKTKAAAKTKPLSKEFADRRSRWRRTDLKVVVRYSGEVLGKQTTLKALAALFPNRDVFNPAEVTGADVGNAMALTVEQVFKFEELASAHAKAQQYAKPLFAFKTMTACDAEAEELARQRRKRRNQRVSDRRRENRAKQRSKAMLQTATATAGRKTIAGLVAEQKARTQAQCDALYAALDPDEFISVSALTERVRSHSAWRTVPSAIIVRDVRTRLDMMTAAGRVENGAAPGPRGSRFRLVRRAKSDRTAARPRE